MRRFKFTINWIASTSIIYLAALSLVVVKVSECQNKVTMSSTSTGNNKSFVLHDPDKQRVDSTSSLKSNNGYSAFLSGITRKQFNEEVLGDSQSSESSHLYNEEERRHRAKRELLRELGWQFDKLLSQSELSELYTSGKKHAAKLNRIVEINNEKTGWHFMERVLSKLPDFKVGVDPADRMNFVVQAGDSFRVLYDWHSDTTKLGWSWDF